MRAVCLARCTSRTHAYWVALLDLSNATCLIRPHVVDALIIVSRITIICRNVHHVLRKPALDK